MSASGLKRIDRVSPPPTSPSWQSTSRTPSRKQTTALLSIYRSLTRISKKGVQIILTTETVILTIHGSSETLSTSSRKITIMRIQGIMAISSMPSKCRRSGVDRAVRISEPIEARRGLKIGYKLCRVSRSGISIERN